MNLSAKVSRLEERAGFRGECPKCKGRGGPSVVVMKAGEEPRDPPGCPHCGKVAAIVKHIFLHPRGETAQVGSQSA